MKKVLTQGNIEEEERFLVMAPVEINVPLPVLSNNVYIAPSTRIFLIKDSLVGLRPVSLAGHVYLNIFKGRLYFYTLTGILLHMCLLEPDVHRMEPLAKGIHYITHGLDRKVKGSIYSIRPSDLVLVIFQDSWEEIQLSDQEPSQSLPGTLTKDTVMGLMNSLQKVKGLQMAAIEITK